MAQDGLLVRCVSCGRNFETRRAGRLTCPVCKTQIWLDPQPGLELVESEEPVSDSEPVANPTTVDELRPAPGGEPDPLEEEHPGDDPAAAATEEKLSDADEELSAEALKRLAELQQRLKGETSFIPAWQLRDEGLFGRFWTTIKQVYGNPSAFFASIEPKSTRGALSFGWIVCTWAVAFFGIYGLWQLSQAGPEQLEQLRQAAAQSGAKDMKPEELIETLRGMFMVSLFASPLLGILNVFVTAGLMHLGVMLVAERHRGFAATFHATAYGFVPLLLVAIPFVGHLIGGLWSVVLQVIAVGQVHRMGPGRAALAVLMPVTGMMLLFWVAM